MGPHPLDEHFLDARVLAAGTDARAAVAVATATATAAALTAAAVTAATAGGGLLVVGDAEVDAPAAVDRLADLLGRRHGHTDLFTALAAAAAVAATAIIAAAAAWVVGFGDGQPAGKRQPTQGGKDSGHGITPRYELWFQG
jgi:MFS family permease